MTLTGDSVVQVIQDFWEDPTCEVVVCTLDGVNAVYNKESTDGTYKVPFDEALTGITDFGEESAVEISNAISEFRNAQDEPNYLEQADLQKYVRTSLDKSASMAALVSAVLFIASVFVFLLKLPGLGIIFAVFGILQARHLALIYKTGLATVFTWLNCASLIFGVIQLIGTLSPNIIEFLQKMLLIQR